MYSTILKKIGKCRLCPPDSGDKYLIAGLCQFHYKNEQSKKYLERQKERNKIRFLQNSPVNKEVAIKNIDLNQWYKRQRKYMTGKCCNCNNPSSKDNEKYWRWSIAHVFPKNIFKSVATNDENWIELCIECHTLFDSNLETASEMKCFLLAAQKFYLFHDKITENHKYKNLFSEYANQL